MSDQGYMVLARRWRPQRFSDLVGQDVVVRTLQNAMKRDCLAHAYLLCGIRGVGKTTIARLLAMVVNCEFPDNGEACGTCPACLSIGQGRNLDVQELDAASHTGVDDIREILDTVRYPPTSLKQKVYIIDEAHMLSKSAFNALLKTLEEPPERVMFVLATTEPEKLPVTVRSRCQRFDLRRLGVHEVARYLGEILGKEKLAYESEALHEIAIAADGSVRDALSLTERVLAFSGGAQLQAEHVRTALGLIGPKQVRVLSDAIFLGDAHAAVRILRAAMNKGDAPSSVLSALGQLWHELACVMVDAQLLEREPGEAGRAWLAAWAECWESQGLDVRYQVLIHGLRDLGWVDERRGAEMLVMRLAGLHTLYPPANIPELETLPEIKPDTEVAQPQIPDAPLKPPEVAIEEINHKEQTASHAKDKTIFGHTCTSWEMAVEFYGEIRPGVSAMLEHVLCLDFGNTVRLALDNHQQQAIAMPERMAFSEWLGREVHWKPKGDQQGETLMQDRAKKAAAKVQQMEQTARDNPHVKMIMEELDAELQGVQAPGVTE